MKGYNATQQYTLGSYLELDPHYISANLAWHGVQSKTNNFMYGDFGCGQGLQLCLLAAANPDCQFVGFDYLPSHIIHGGRIAEQAGLSNVRFLEYDFEDPMDREFTAQFDYIVSHGTLSWISPSLRVELVKKMSTCLKPGGVASVSYNTKPGWNDVELFQKSVIARCSTGESAEDALKKAIEDTSAVVDKSLITEARMPYMSKLLAALTDKPMNYLTQEYGNFHWEPLYVSDVRQLFREHKLNCAGHTFFKEEVLSGITQLENVLPDISTADRDYLELMTDLNVCRKFRRELYVKDHISFDGRTDLLLDDFFFGGADATTILDRETLTGFSKSVAIEENVRKEVSLKIRDLEIFSHHEIASKSGLSSEAAFKHLLLLASDSKIVCARSAPHEKYHTDRLNLLLGQLNIQTGNYPFVAIPSFGSGIKIDQTSAQLLWAEQLPGKESLGHKIANYFDQMGKIMKRGEEVLSSSDIAAHFDKIAETSSGYALLKRLVLPV